MATSRRDARAHERSIWADHQVDEPATRAHAPAVHEHVALAFFVDGSAVLEQRERYDVRTGDVMLVPAGERHRLLGRRSRTVAWTVGFCAPCLAPSELAPLLDPFDRARNGASPVVSIPTHRQSHLARLCAELRSETASPLAHGDLARRSLLALVLTEIARAAGAPRASELSPSVVGDALRFIERRCLEPISLEDVARAVGRSPAHLTTVVKRATGKSVVEWIIAGRLAEARNRLLHSDERIDVIAERVGYADSTHFIRLFRRQHGVTPAAWRSARRGGDEPTRA